MSSSGSSSHRLTIAQLAETTGIPVDVLREWEAHGLLSGSDDSFGPRDVERVRIIQFVERRGIPAESLAAVCESQGDLVGSVVDLLPSGPRPEATRPLDGAAAAVGLDLAVVLRLWEAAGLGDPGDVYDEDVAALRSLRVALDAGLPEDALAQILRVFADALGRVADAESRLFHYYVHEQLRAQGLTGTELTAATQAIGEPLAELIEPTLIYFHRKAWERALREDLLLHLVEDTTPPGDVPGELDATILFADLCGFTPLTEAMGDPAAAGLVERFSVLVRQTASRHTGTVVKQLGDAFMLVFTGPLDALGFGLDLEAASSTEDRFPALRQGADTGRVLYREGDYFGTTVNTAARVAAAAEPHQLLITSAVRSEVTDLVDVAFEPVGPRALKGIAKPVELYDVSRAGRRPVREIDPVCLMELDRSSTTAQLSWRGTRWYFCSEQCLALFAAEPERYRPSG